MRDCRRLKKTTSKSVPIDDICPQTNDLYLRRSRRFPAGGSEYKWKIAEDETHIFVSRLRTGKLPLLKKPPPVRRLEGQDRGHLVARDPDAENRPQGGCDPRPPDGDVHGELVHVEARVLVKGTRIIIDDTSSRRKARVS